MFPDTLEKLRCVRCHAGLKLIEGERDSRGDVLWGKVGCASTKHSFPILAGVLILATDLEQALISRVKGITALVPDDRIPRKQVRNFLEAREQFREEGLFDEGMEEDLESERVNALYVLNHFLAVEQVPRTGMTPIDALVDQHWNQGPLDHTSKWLRQREFSGSVLELGCSVGGLASRLAGQVKAYLGIDASFTSVALARHLVLGAPYPRPIRFPGDLLDGPGSLNRTLKKPSMPSGTIDFVLADLNELSPADGSFDCTAALGVIDMLEEPVALARLQRQALAPGGIAIQASPYIWHEPIARKLRALKATDSVQTVLKLYSDAGFELIESCDQIPWIFFKHVRQVELYSVHWMAVQNPRSALSRA